MGELKMTPDGWPCTLEKCNPGFFVWNNILCYKSEYRRIDGKIETFNAGGEYLSSITDDDIVQPVTYEWVN